ISAWFSSAHRAGRVAPMADHASTLFVLTLLALAASCVRVHGQDLSKYRTLIPPAEYDRPYKGALTVHVNQLQQNMLQAGQCKLAFPGQFLFACNTIRPGYGCTIWMAPESEIVARGLTWELVMRHEIGHCNGWPADHAGGRPFIASRD